MYQILDIYTSYVLPFLTIHKRQTRVSISTAVGLLTLYWVYKTVRPPRPLRSIPSTGFSGYFSLMFRGRPIHEFSDLTLAASTQGPSGLCTRYELGGWVVRITRPEVAKAVLLKTEMFPKADSAMTRKDTLVGRFAFGDNIMMLNGAHWKAQRKIANPVFHRSMPIDLFGRLANKMLAVMDQDIERPFNFDDMTSRITLDAIGLAGFGFDFNATAEKDNEWCKMYSNFSEAHSSMFFFFFPFFDRGSMLNLFPKRRRAHEDLTRFLNRMDDIIAHKRQVLVNGKGNDKSIEDRDKDLLTLMLEAQESENDAMTNEELKSNLCIFFLAGHDTTATALNFAIYYMATNKDVQEKARQEAIRILGDDPKDVRPDAQQARSFSYIDMVIKETLRISPPVPGIFNRAPVEDTEIAGVFIPKGTQLGLDIYTLHHNPTVWEDPETFDPERFRPGGEYDELSKTGMPWVPFSSGGRMCIGMNFSMDEQRVILPMLLRKYEWELPEDSIHKDRPQLRFGLGVSKLEELYIQFKRRY